MSDSRVNRDRRQARAAKQAAFAIIAHERRINFATLNGAKTAAQDYFERTGNIVGIVEVTR